jgi:hypothetical protein
MKFGSVHIRFYLFSFIGDILFQPCTADTQNMQNVAFNQADSPPNAILVPSCPEGLICNNWCVPADLSELYHNLVKFPTSNFILYII